MSRWELTGRSQEHFLLSRWLAEAVGGSPRIVRIEGDAGTGKTSLAEWLADLAQQRGSAVTRGGWQPDDLPFRALSDALEPVIGNRSSVAALRAAVLSDDLDELSTDLTARFEAGRLAVMADAVRAASAERCLLVLLDDLHWAEEASSQLLSLLVASMSRTAATAGSHLLVVLTHRPLDDQMPASRLVARLSRHPASRQLLLRDLDEMSVHELVIRRLGVRPTPELLRSLMELTSGNPLHVVTCLDSALARGDLVRDGSRLVGSLDPTRGVRSFDDDVRDLLDELDGDQLEFAVTAACLGAASSLRTLGAAVSRPPEEVAFVLAQPPLDRILEVAEDRWRFLHPELHRTVYRYRSRREREARHTEVGERLARDLADAPETASLIDRQFRLGGDAGEPGLVTEYARRAGIHSLRLGAWGDASRALGRASAGAARIGSSSRELTDLHLLAGEAAHHDHDARTAEPHFESAIGLARADDDADRWGRAALGLIRTRLTSGQHWVGRRGETDVIADFLSAHGDHDHALTARLHELLAEVAFSSFDFEEGFRQGAAARAAAERAGRPEVLALVAFAEGLQFFGGLILDEAEPRFEESHQHALDAGDLWISVWGPVRSLLCHMLRGRLDEVAVRAPELAAQTASMGNWTEHSTVLACEAWRANLTGDFDRAESQALAAAEIITRTDYAFGPAMVYPQLALARAMRGDRAGAAAAIDEWSDRVQERRGLGAFRSVALFEASTEPVPDVEVRVPRGPVSIANAAGFALAVEHGSLAGDAERVREAAGAVSLMLEQGVRITPASNLFVPRLKAMTDAVSGEHQAAAFERAEAEAAAMGAIVEMARCRLAWARVVVAAEPDRAEEAAAGAVSALTTFHSVDAIPLAVRAERFLDGLEVPRPAAAPSALTRVILYTDIVESTQRNAEVGDAVFFELMRTHNHIVRSWLAEFGGFEFKHTGDGIGAWFRDATNAVRYALAVQDDLERANLDPTFGIRVRMGMAAGDPREHEGDLFGLAVVRAVRVCALAGADQVLVSEELRPMLGDDVRLVSMGLHRLKGLPEDTVVYRVLRPA